MGSFDYALVGGGLQNALIACALSRFRPQASVALIDRETELGRHHTWCFHEQDVEPGLQPLVLPLVAHEWSGYDVAFPSYERTVVGGYKCITGDRLDATLRGLFAARQHYHLYLGQNVSSIGAEQVELTNGERIRASLVVDARGPASLDSAPIAGYQKFLGLELELARPVRQVRPMLMDARVEQLDGFRFVYVLPFTPERLLVEDTYFSDTATLDRVSLRERVLEYARARGFSVKQVLREETGVLPLPRRLSTPSVQPPLLAGYRGGWFHPTTGYSLPAATRLAALLAQHSPEALFGPALTHLSKEHARQTRFGTLLNRMLFDACDGATRRNVFERFYTLADPTIARFYALSTTALDRARILCGRPPRGISLRRAVFGGKDA